MTLSDSSVPTAYDGNDYGLIFIQMLVIEVRGQSRQLSLEAHVLSSLSQILSSFLVPLRHFGLLLFVCAKEQYLHYSLIRNAVPG
jgi:hypothetical protein